jgi:membrane protein
MPVVGAGRPANDDIEHLDDARPAMSRIVTEARRLLRDTFFASIEDGVVHRGAALAFYVLLSLGPLLLLLIGGLQVFLTQETVRSGVLDAIATYLGPGAADTAATVLEDAQAPVGVSWSSGVAVALLLFGATAVFANVRGSLNAIWGVRGETPSGTAKEMLLDFLVDFLRTRLRGFVMITLTGAILLVSFVLTYTVSVVEPFLVASIPVASLWGRVVEAVVSVTIIGLLFGTIFRTLPERRIGWPAVWVGGYVTAILFFVGKELIARFIAAATWTTYYGPGTSVVAFMFWVYLSAQIFFLGAEFTKAWATRYHHFTVGGQGGPPTHA